MRNSSELVEVDYSRLEEVLRRAEQSLEEEEDSTLVRVVFRLYADVADLVEDKNTSIRRLRHLFFGRPREMTEAVVGRKANEAEAAPPREARADPFRRPARGSRTRRRPQSATGVTAPRLTGLPPGLR